MPDIDLTKDYNLLGQRVNLGGVYSDFWVYPFGLPNRAIVYEEGFVPLSFDGIKYIRDNNTETPGELPRCMIAEADYASYRLSPAGKYVSAYNPTDSCWYTINLADDRKIRLTTPQTFTAWDEDNDTPNYPSSYGHAGWTKDDASLLIYDRYDIWSFDPEGKKAPIKLTKNGREAKVRYTRINLDKEQAYIDLKQPMMIKGFNEVNKSTGIYRARLSTPSNPALLAGGNYNYGNLMKAKKADKYIYSRENYEVYPDIWATDANFKKGTQLTQGIRQQEPFIWGNADMDVRAGLKRKLSAEELMLLNYGAGGDS